MFLQPLGEGAILLLSGLLLVSTLIGLKYSSVKSVSGFLIADNRGRWFDFAASQIGYIVGVASTVIIYPALAYAYGPIMIPVVCFAWLISLAVYYFFLYKNQELNNFLKTRYGLPQFVFDGFPEGKGTNFLYRFSFLILALTFWGLFGLELVGLQKLFGVIFTQSSNVHILILAFVLTVLYVILGGYLSTIRTDFFQTLFLIIISCYIAFSMLPEHFSAFQIPNIFSSDIVSKSPKASTEEVAAISVIIILTGIGYLLTAQDIWARSTAVSQKVGHRNSYIGLVISILACVPYVAIFMMGIYMFAVNPNLPAEDFEKIPSLLVKMLTGKASVGWFIPTLIATAISTASTALMTSVQAIQGVSTEATRTISRCRVTTAVVGLFGIATGLAFPDIVSGVFALSGVPLAFLPLIFARMWKKTRKVWISAVVLTISTIIALVAGLYGGDVAKSAPLIVFVFSLLLYPLLTLVPLGRKAQ